MHPILQNKYVRFAGIGLASLVALFIILLILNYSTLSSSQSMNNSLGIGGGDSGFMAPSSVGLDYSRDSMMSEKSISNEYYAPQPNPTPDDFTANLESYETTSYQVNARTKQFDELCNTFNTLKADSGIHFKSLDSSLNNCTAVFYVSEQKAAGVLATLTAFSGVEVNRNTESVTRHRTQIQNQTTILQQQLTSVENSLTAAESQFTEIAEFARESKDAATLSLTIREKISIVENLTQQKIQLTSQLNQLYQQAADLEERLNVIAFSVSVNRANPIYINKQSQKWDQAWEELKDEFTNTSIVLTVSFLAFLLRALQFIVYGLIIILVLRLAWKFIKLLWSRGN